MPTAGRLTAAIAFLALAFYVTVLMGPLFGETRVPNYFFPVSLGIGIWSGWVVCGKRAGRGYSAAVGNGLTAAFAMVFWILAFMAFSDMMRKAIRKTYDGPMDGLADMFLIGGDFAREFADPNLIMVILVGGVAAGLFSEFFAKRMP